MTVHICHQTRAELLDRRAELVKIEHVLTHFDEHAVRAEIGEIDYLLRDDQK